MNSAQANAVAAIVVGAYLLAANLRVGGKQRMEKLIALLMGEAGFFKWALALGLLWYISTRKELGEVGTGLIATAALGLAIKIANDPTILSGIGKAWNALPDLKQKAKG